MAAWLPSHEVGTGRERLLKVWVSVALEKETAWWPTSVPRSLKVRLIPPGFPWTHLLLPSGSEGVRKYVCLRASFSQLFLRSHCVANTQAQVIAVAGMRLP